MNFAQRIVSRLRRFLLGKRLTEASAKVNETEERLKSISARTAATRSKFSSLEQEIAQNRDKIAQFELKRERFLKGELPGLTEEELQSEGRELLASLASWNDRSGEVDTEEESISQELEHLGAINERIARTIDDLQSDYYLALSLAVSLLGAGVTIYMFVANPNVAHSVLDVLSVWFHWLVGNAHGAEPNTNSPMIPKDGIQYLILAVISLVFFYSFEILTFSNKSDSRKIAADTIKTILGVYIGILTKLAG